MYLFSPGSPFDEIGYETIYTQERRDDEKVKDTLLPTVPMSLPVHTFINS